jgi:GxxExxY protein
MNHRVHGDAEARSGTDGFEPASAQLNALAERVIGAAIEVHRALGVGFEEGTYHRALMIELQLLGIPFKSEEPVVLEYKGQTIGNGKIDLLIDDQLVAELKAAPANPKKYSRQALAYLKATGLRLGLIINFEVELLKDGVSRVILD